jgi:hypothetical protein
VNRRKHQTLRERIINLLRDGVPRTGKDIHAAVGRSYGATFVALSDEWARHELRRTKVSREYVYTLNPEVHR